MVNSMSENQISSYTRLASKKKLTPTKYKSADENLSKKYDLHTRSPNKKSPKSVTQINTITEEPSIETKINQIENNISPLCEIKLRITRIDDTDNFKAMLSPRSLENHLKKSQQKSEDNKKEDLVIRSDADKLFHSSKKRTTRKSVNGFGKLERTSDVEVANIIETKRSSKSTQRFGDPVDFDKIDMSSTSPKKKQTKKTPIFSSHSSDSDSKVDTLRSVTSKPTTRKSLMAVAYTNDGEVTNVKTKITRKTSVSTPSKSENNVKELKSVTPKRITRKSLMAAAYTNDGEVTNIETKRIQNTPVSTPSKSRNAVNTLNSVESVTPNHTRKSISEFGESAYLNDTEIENTPKSYKRSRQMSMNTKEEDLDFENEWKTPVNKRNRLSYTPTIHSGSNVRRSILQNIPENKEIDVVSTPKTPKKTPKTHVKNLTASLSKRSDCGVRIPCSPLEKARANLHLHAAPKHLPCREVEFKSIHSFLARKINDELTGSMYISGVPGTGKTATVKRVIDSLNTDLIMKHSFKFIEVNGLKLANPHQAFSVIWKELTAETVSSSRAQVLLDNYFSGNEVRELSTILLVDEVDHICNRKQDVVYNILDWPSRIGSKVVVITIANTMDLPERVLRGCVTSRMGLTRLVFKPYTFQQLQEIIMNRLIGNSSFDPDAVQLVARKVAAVSGDARRALDICRRAIDLIKDDDETQLITINHVNQVLNSILTGVRVTAIRYCSLFEKTFLRALRDETTRTGFDHSTIYSIYDQMKNICLLEGEELPDDQQVVMMAYRLRDNGLIFLEKKRWDLFRKVSLNVSPEDISYALDKYNN